MSPPLLSVITDCDSDFIIFRMPIEMGIEMVYNMQHKPKFAELLKKVEQQSSPKVKGEIQKWQDQKKS